MLFGAHEVHPKDEIDWTQNADLGNEMKLRLVRNAMIKEMLVGGRTVQYRSTGDSLKPRVRSNDVTMWEPVKDHSLLKVGDIVFCVVQEGDRFYGHAIHEIGTWTNGKTYWMIGNLKNPPHINGWCYAEHIFGRLMEVSPIQPRASRLEQPAAWQ